MTSLTQIREAVADALAAIPDLNTYPVVPDAAATPAAYVEPSTEPFWEYDQDFDGSEDFHLLVTVLTSRVDANAGQEAVDAYVSRTGPESVKAAVEADPTLGGLVSDCHVTAARDYGILTLQGIDYYGCRFSLDGMLTQ